MVIKAIEGFIIGIPMTIDSNSYKEFFPYPEPRKGQSEMMLAIEEAVRTGVNICSEAPNGFGKTCVTLSGILPWVKENNGKILYCARTHRQLDRVVEELVEISKRQDVSGVSFRGRRHMCLNPFVIENSDFVAPISEVCGQLKATGRCSYYEKLKKSRDVFCIDSRYSVRSDNHCHFCLYDL